MDEKEGETQLFPKAKKEINDFVQRVEEHKLRNTKLNETQNQPITRDLL